MSYKDKYIKYKTKYLELKNSQSGGKTYDNYNDDINIDHKIELPEPWFTLIALELKTVEGMLNTEKNNKIKQGDVIEWYNKDFKIERRILTEVVGKKQYKSFTEYLLEEGLVNALPGIETFKEGLSIYQSYYNKNKENKYGVVSYNFELIK